LPSNTLFYFQFHRHFTWPHWSNPICACLYQLRIKGAMNYSRQSHRRYPRINVIDSSIRVILRFSPGFEYLLITCLFAYWPCQVFTWITHLSKIYLAKASFNFGVEALKISFAANALSCARFIFLERSSNVLIRKWTWSRHQGPIFKKQYECVLLVWLVFQEKVSSRWTSLRCRRPLAYTGPLYISLISTCACSPSSYIYISLIMNNDLSIAHTHK